MSSDRFQTREMEGFPFAMPLTQRHSSSNNKPSLQVLVLDAAYDWRVVARFDTSMPGANRPREARYAAVRAAAAAEAARLNGEHAAWAAAG